MAKLSILGMRHAMQRRQRLQEGFSLIEVLIAMLVLMIAMLAVLSLVANTVVAMAFSQQDLIAKQKAREILEGIISARSTQQIIFTQIQNVTAGGIFVDGFQQMRTAGTDGLVGTADDGAIEDFHTPGPDGLFGTADDIVVPLTNFQRRIAITPVLQPNGTAYTNLNQITVTVRYQTANGQFRSYQVTSYVSQYR